MAQDTTNKRLPVITIIAAFLCVLHFIAVVLNIFAGVTHSYSYIFLAILVAIGVPNLVLAIISKREHSGKTHAALLVVTILLFVTGACFSLLGITQISIRDNKEERNREAQETALKLTDINHIKRILPAEKLKLRNSENINSDLYCYDVTGAIVQQFRSMEFTYQDYETKPELNDVSFVGDEDYSVTFFKDYSGIEIESHVSRDSLMYGPIFYGLKKTYSVDKVEGEKLRDMINNTISEQLLAYQELENYIINNLTLESAINSMDEEGVSLRCTYFDKKSDYVNTDNNRDVLKALKEIDFSKVTIYEGEAISLDNGFVYRNLKETNYCILSYNHDNKTMKVTKYYQDMFNYRRNVVKRYLIAEEDGVALMSAAKNVAIDQNERVN